MLTGAAPTGFDQFIQTAGAILQLWYLLLLPVAALFAAWQFKRFVDIKAGKGVPAESEEKDVAVEDFVE